jgi:hypothetical protein
MAAVDGFINNDVLNQRLVSGSVWVYMFILYIPVVRQKADSSSAMLLIKFLAVGRAATALKCPTSK